jgi:hypothetical protein
MLQDVGFSYCPFFRASATTVAGALGKSRFESLLKDFAWTTIGGLLLRFTKRSAHSIESL